MYFLKRNACFFLLIFFIMSCKKKNNQTIEIKKHSTQNLITDASGLAIFSYENFTIINVKTPWPNAVKPFTYILKKTNKKLPDSLSKYPSITVPVNRLVVTSTTIIPFLEMLKSEEKLIGFPHTDYISSEKTRFLINNGKIKDLGQNENINIELTFDLQPDVIIAFGIDNNNKMVEKLSANGLKVFFQADWMEQSPLGKAEWIKFYGALLGKEKEANTLFETIKNEYLKTKNLTQNTSRNQKILYGSLYKDKWFVARGNSWIAQFINDAKGEYLWKNLTGVGSEPFSFETIFEKGANADIWITKESFTQLEMLAKENHHYEKFEAFQKKKVYTFESEKGPTGGTVYYELAPSRPDLVLKDYIKIIHPEILPNYQFTFAKKLD